MIKDTDSFEEQIVKSIEILTVSKMVSQSIIHIYEAIKPFKLTKNETLSLLHTYFVEIGSRLK